MLESIPYSLFGQCQSKTVLPQNVHSLLRLPYMLKYFFLFKEFKYNQAFIFNQSEGHMFLSYYIEITAPNYVYGLVSWKKLECILEKV